MWFNFGRDIKWKILECVVGVYGENWLLLADEPAEFEKQPVEVQDFKKITNHLEWIYGIYHNLANIDRKIITCNQLDLEALEYQPIMPKNLPWR